MAQTTIRNQTFIMHSSGGIYWRQQQVLLMADLHLGKVSHFRKHGSALPLSAALGDFEKLQEVYKYFRPAHLILLGDLFHSGLNQEWHLWEKWLENTDAEVTLIRGNHDVIPAQLYQDSGVSVFDELRIGGFLMTHHPQPGEGYFNFCGHIHPAVRLKGSGGQRAKIPCFFLSTDQMILPAFGKLTGSHVLKPGKHHKVYALVEDQVIKVV